MRQLLATARRSPASLVGPLVALTGAAVMVTLSAQIIGSAQTAHVPVHRLAGAPVVVTADAKVRFVSGHGDSKDTTAYALATPRRIPDVMVARLASVPGVNQVVADVTVAETLMANGRRPVGVEVHGWSSAALTPARLSSGHRPVGARDIALSRQVARRLGLHPGDAVRLGGRTAPSLTVSALLADGVGTTLDAYVPDTVARSWFGHPGQTNLLAVLPTPGTDPATVARDLRTRLGHGYDVLTGSARGAAEDPAAVGSRDDVTAFGFAAFGPVVAISLFVIAGAVGLSVAGRRRHFALLRAVGATPGQIRRSVAGELAVLGILGGGFGYLLGGLIAPVVVRGLVRHDLLPAGSTCWSAHWLLPIACGAGLIVSQLSGVVAARRAARADPLVALREAAVEPSRPNPIRVTLGVVSGVGAIVLAVLVLKLMRNPNDQLNLALLILMAFTASVGLLGPVLVSGAELLLRLPARGLGGVGARLAMADLRRRPGRVAAAIVAVAMSVSFLGTVYLVNETATRRGHEQNAQRVRADLVATAPGGLDAAAVHDLATLPGVISAVGMGSTTAYPHLAGGDQVAAVALTPGPITGVLDLKVHSGRLAAIVPGQVAVSRLEAGHTKVGDELSLYLPDGTPYRARVVAIYDRALGFGDLVLPTGAAGGGHLGATVDQVLIQGRPNAVAVAALSARIPGLQVSTRSVANRQADRAESQDVFLNNLIVALIGALALVTLVNTLVTATVSRRGELGLLGRIGATRSQILRMAGWQVLTVVLLGAAAGVAAGATALTMVTRALTGDWHPYLPPATVTGVGTGLVALTATAVLVPTALLTRGRRRPARAQARAVSSS